MPVVPRYGDEREKLRSAPAVRFQTTASEEAFGGGQSLEVLSETAQSGVRKIGQMQLEFQAKADEVKAQDADTQLSILETDLKNGAANMRGKDAFGAPDYVDDGWRKGSEEILKGLNARQKAIVQRSANARYSSLYGATQAHIANESLAYDNQSTKDSITAAQKQAAVDYGNWNPHNPDNLVSRSLFQQQEAIQNRNIIRVVNNPACESFNIPLCRAVDCPLHNNVNSILIIFRYGANLLNRSVKIMSVPS